MDERRADVAKCRHKHKDRFHKNRNRRKMHVWTIGIHTYSEHFGCDKYTNDNSCSPVGLQRIIYYYIPFLASVCRIGLWPKPTSCATAKSFAIPRVPHKRTPSFGTRNHQTNYAYTRSISM